MIIDFLHDAAYALRTLASERRFAATAILTLTLGIGANTAIFSVVDAVVLRPLAAPDPDSLVRFVTTTAVVRRLAAADQRGRTGFGPSPRARQPDRGR